MNLHKKLKKVIQVCEQGSSIVINWRQFTGVIYALSELCLRTVHLNLRKHASDAYTLPVPCSHTCENLRTYVRRFTYIRAKNYVYI
jgi:hypothetical protein